MAWRTMDVGRGRRAYRVWCGACNQDWTQPIAAIAARVAGGEGRPNPVSTFCECGSAIRVLPFDGTLQVDEPLQFAEVAARVGEMDVAVRAAELAHD
ncbi:MAG TPA: hypothetical protein VFC09_13045 [Candidatus Dormibacteraeota bacterium]|nr:hypothetical protein [Candidatus Dormibacteraeota bacterium]